MIGDSCLDELALEQGPELLQIIPRVGEAGLVLHPLPLGLRQGHLVRTWIDLGDLHDAGLHFDAALLLNIPGFPIALRPEFSLTQFKLKEPVLATPDADDVTNMMAFMGNLEVPLGGGLYVLAGGGILSMSVPEALAPDGEEESSNKFTFDAGAGLRFALGGIRGFVEARIGAASYDEGKLGFSRAQRRAIAHSAAAEAAPWGRVGPSVR